MSDCLYFIPARGGSKRFPLKNIAPLRGRPLVILVSEIILAADAKAEIVISTDDDRIVAVLAELLVGPLARQVKVDHRPKNLGGDSISVAQVLKEFIERAQPRQETCFCVYPTAVLLSPQTVKASLEKFEANPKIASMMGASEFNLHPWQALHRAEDGGFVPYFPDLYQKKAQEFPEFLASNGSFYLVRSQQFSKNPDFYASPLDLFPIPATEFVDINYPQDLERAERILSWKKRE